MIVSLIVAHAVDDGAIGYQGGLPWHLPADLARFKRLTMGHCLLMGRRTFESLQGRRLPGRSIILLSRTTAEVPDGADSLASSLPQALQQAQYRYKDNEAFIAGGAGIYQQALDLELVDRMYITLVHARAAADTFFPAYEAEDWEVIKQELRPADEKNEFDLTFLTLSRISPAPAA